jgi:hypothetical protein
MKNLWFAVLKPDYVIRNSGYLPLKLENEGRNNVFKPQAY